MHLPAFRFCACGVDLGDVVPERIAFWDKKDVGEGFVGGKGGPEMKEGKCETDTLASTAWPFYTAARPNSTQKQQKKKRTLRFT